MKKSAVVIVVTWNSEKDIRDCLTSLRRQDYSNLFKVIVVDNNSSDKTVEIIEKEFSEVFLIKSKINTFFTGGNNIGIKHAILDFGADIVALLNPDTYADSNWLSESIKFLNANPEVGVVAPKILFWNNANEGLINSAGMVYDGFLQAYDRGVMQVDKGQFDQNEEMQALSGTAMVFRKEVLVQTGLFWERLRMYLEDLELSIRIRKKGWKLYYICTTKIGHKYMQSTNQSKIVLRKGWLDRNYLLVALKHYKWKNKLAMLKYYLIDRKFSK